MPPSAHEALVVSIVASALGALIMCLLVARYGLTPGVQEDAAAAARRLVVTRLGHAFAGVCFVVTGVLGLVAVSVQAREAPPAPAPPPAVVVEPDPAAEERLRALVAEVESIAARLNQLSTRVDQVSTRVAASDTTARRLRDDVASVQLRARELERTMAALPQRTPVPDAARPTRPAERPAPPPPSDAPSPPAPPTVILPPPPPPTSIPPSPEPSAVPRTSVWTRTPEPRATMRPSAPPVRAPGPSADVPRAAAAAHPREPAPRSPAAGRRPEPAGAPRSLPMAPRATEPAAASRASAPPAQATVQAPRRGTDGGAAAARRDDLPDKLREDWKTIREGLATAGDDLKDALRDLGRKLWR